MKDGNIEGVVTFRELKWDTEFFDITCVKAILHKPLTRTEWEGIKERFGDYQFISIENHNSVPANAQLIGADTTAFLADVNIQFKKKLGAICEMPKAVQIYQGLKRDERIIEMGNFKFSKFTEDPELAKRGGSEVYKQWLINSFKKPDKYFAVTEGEKGEPNGFLLHSYTENSCTIELIAVLSNVTKSGIGTSLFRAVEFTAYQCGYNEIKVGTQVQNMAAINFYHKVGCKQVGCHQVYHLWNL